MSHPTSLTSGRLGFRPLAACLLAIATSAATVPVPLLATPNSEYEEQSDTQSFSVLKPVRCSIDGKVYLAFHSDKVSYTINVAADEEPPAAPVLSGLPEGWTMSSATPTKLAKDSSHPLGGVRHVISLTNGKLSRNYEFWYVFRDTEEDVADGQDAYEHKVADTDEGDVQKDATDGKEVPADGSKGDEAAPVSEDYAEAKRLYDEKLAAVEDAEERLDAARNELDAAKRRLDKAKGVEVDDGQVGAADAVGDAPSVSNLTVSFPTAVPTVVSRDGTLITPSPESCGIRNLSPFGIHMSALGMDVSWPFRLVHDGEPTEGGEGLITLLMGSSKERIDMAECHPKRSTSSPDKWSAAANDAGDGGGILPIMVSGKVLGGTGDIGNGRTFGTVTWHIAPDEVPEGDSDGQANEDPEEAAMSDDGENPDKDAEKNLPKDSKKSPEKEPDKATEKSASKDADAKNQSN